MSINPKYLILNYKTHIKCFRKLPRGLGTNAHVTGLETSQQIWRVTGIEVQG